MSGKVSSLIGVIAVWVIASGAPTAYAESLLLREYQIKAAFLYNFVKFVEWPDEALPDPSAPIALCVLGEDPFGVALESINDKTVKGRQLMVKRFVGLQDLKVCHILFISPSEEKDLAQILASLKNSSILTVGETEGFTQFGGIISFTMESNKIRFEINEDAAGRAGLKISSKLLNLAKVVR